LYTLTLESSIMEQGGASVLGQLKTQIIQELWARQKQTYWSSTMHLAS